MAVNSSVVQSVAIDGWTAIAGLLLQEDVVVVMDEPSAEVCHWTGATEHFLQCVSVVNFSVDHTALQTYRNRCKTLAFIISENIRDRIETVAEAVRSLEVTTCFLFVPYYPPHEAKGIEQPDLAAGFKSFAQETMQKFVHFDVNFKIHKVSLFHYCLCPGIFMAPSFASIPTLDMPEQGNKPCANMLGEALSSFLTSLDVCEDIFSLGKTSSDVASYMESSTQAQTRRKNAGSRCSLLLVDRSLDLSTATSHSLDSLGDAVYGLLPRLPGHCTDVAVNMEPVFPENQKCPLPGSTSVTGQAKNERLLSSFFFKRQKDCTMGLSRHILDALTEEGVQVDMRPGRLGKGPQQQLQYLLGHFKGDLSALKKHRGLLQLSCAALQALSHTHTSKWEQLLSVEKLVALYIREGDVEQAFAQVIHYAKQQAPSAEEGHSAVEHVLGLCCHLYSLLGPDIVAPHASEDALKDVLCSLLTQSTGVSPSSVQQMGLKSPVVEADIRRFISSQLFNALHQVQVARSGLKQFRKLIKPDVSEPFQPLIVQVMEAIFDSSKPSLGDISHHSQGLAGKLLQTGFSFFMSSSLPRPNNHPLMIVFVIGGVTCGEVRRLQEIASNHAAKCQVLVGSSSILKPGDAVQRILTHLSE